MKKDRFVQSLVMLFVLFGVVIFKFNLVLADDPNFTIVSGSDSNTVGAQSRKSKNVVKLQETTPGDSQLGNVNVDGAAIFNSVSIGTSTNSSILELKSSNSPMARFNGSTTAWVTLDFVREDNDKLIKSNIGLAHSDFFDGNAMVIGTFNGEVWTDPLVIENGAPTGSIYINGGGHVGIGTENPLAQLEITAFDAPAVIVNGSHTTWTTQDFQRNGEVRASIGISPVDIFGGNAAIIGSFDGEEFTDPLVIENSAPTGSIYVNSDGLVSIGTTTATKQLNVAGDLLVTGAITEGSSAMLKRDINYISGHEAISTLKNLKPVKYKYKADSSSEEYLGFIAEEVPDFVGTNDHKRLRTMDIVAVLTKVIQEQQKTIEKMEKDMKTLKSKVILLKTQL